MSIDYLTKDITTVDKGVIVHGCNCSGGFGSGVAGAIRKKWPYAYEAHKEMGVGEELLGTVNILLRVTEDVVIVNGYTQVKYGRDGKRYADVAAIYKVLSQTAEFVDGGGYKDLYMPKIGAGLGGLDWETEVLPIVEMVSSEFPDVNIHICDI